MCTTFRKQDNRVAEMRMGSMSVTPEYACDKEYFNNTLIFHTIKVPFRPKHSLVPLLMVLKGCIVIIVS